MFPSHDRLGLGLTGLLAKAVYDDTKSRAGGLAQTPQVMMDQLGRYQLSKELGTGGTRGEFGLAPKPAVLDIANMGQRQALASGDEVKSFGMNSSNPNFAMKLAKQLSQPVQDSDTLQDLINGWAQVTAQGGQLSRDLSPKYIESIMQVSGMNENDPVLNQMLQEALRKQFSRKNFA